MTLHVVYDHQCPKCDAHYIPYDTEVPCPQCGFVEEDRFDYIQQAAASLRFNKYEGSYTPGGWWVGSLGDHFLRLLFPLFDAFEEELGSDFADFASSRLGQVDWGDQQYLRDHILGIAIRLHAELEEPKE